MRLLLKNMTVTGISLLLLTACKKNEYPVYDTTTSYVNIWLGTSSAVEDSLVYNFSLKPERPLDSVLFTARLMGLLGSKDKKFTLKAVGGDTTRIKEGIHYRFGNYTMKANAYTGIYPIYILRTKDFVDTTFSIRFAISKASELPGGISDMQEIKLLLRDRFQKPDNWDVETSFAYRTLSTFFSTYSKVKFQFITTTTGVAPSYRVRYSGVPIPPDEISYTQAQYYSNSCKTALSNYNASHTTPLKDEFGQTISF